MDFPNKKYKIIYADPPWEYDDKAVAGKRGVEFKYDVMNFENICKLPISTIADEDCILFLWCTWVQIQQGLDVIKSWGFDYKTVGFVWVKNDANGRQFIGMGNWTRSNSEFCLIGIRGKPKRINARVRQVITSIRTIHSKKPNIVRNKIITLCGDLPRIELFARTKIHGWDTWGNDEKLENQPLEVFS